MAEHLAHSKQMPPTPQLLVYRMEEEMVSIMLTSVPVEYT